MDYVRYIVSFAIAVAGAVLIALLCSCSSDIRDMGSEPEEQGTRTLVLPDGNGCTGKLRFTGGGYAAIHYNFHCDDGRIFVNLTNAEVK